MAIFTAIATAALTGTFLAGSAIATSLLAGTLALGSSYAVQSLMGNQNKPASAAKEAFSVVGRMQTGGAVPRSFNLGYSLARSSLVYSNEWGQNGETPNAYHTKVIALQDLPGGTLREVWINGQLCSLDGALPGEMGYPVPEYRKNGVDHAWIKYYDGSQTAADPFLISKVSSAEYPYENTRVGVGVAYAICTFLIEETLFNGTFPECKFALSGIPLYDPTKDSTAGGAGAQRWSDRSTWGGDGDNLVAVQIYNLWRGITFQGKWVYGLQRASAARLPLANWLVQIDKCRAEIAGPDGPEPTYRAGGAIAVNTQLANSSEALLTAGHGRMAEIGGFYKLKLGAPDTPTFSFTDADILVTEEQEFKPFKLLSDSVNGIAATYPYPAEAWNPAKVAPPIYRTDLEAADGNRRLMVNTAFDLVPYPAQVQRLMSSAIEEAQRARMHIISLPPAYWIVEPLDVGIWNSDRNGYIDKLFRVDGMVDRANLDVGMSLTEVDPSDYNPPDYKSVTTGQTIIARPAPQGIVDWFVEPDIIDDGISPRRPAIRLRWDGNMPGVTGVTYQVRLAADETLVTTGNTDQLAVGALRISQSLLPLVDYEARGQYIPSAPRDMLWSDWLAVTTPDIRFNYYDQAADIQAQITDIIEELRGDIADTLNRIATGVGNQAASGFTDVKQVRFQLAAQFEKSAASIENVRTVLVAADEAIASDVTTLTGTVGTNTAAISQEAIVRSNADSALAGTITTLSSTVGTNTAAISSEATTRANADSAITATVSSLTSTVNANTSAISSEATTRANADTAFAGSISSLSTTVGGHTASLQLVASSVNGSSIYLGLVGNIDGVTGGLILTGVRSGVAVTYNLLFDGNLTVNGSISATKIAINGVDILNIVPGAATFRTTTTFGTGTGISFGAQTVSIKSGTATCCVSGSFSSSGGPGNVILQVDGADLAFFDLPNGTVSGSYVWDVVGLSVGNHTFAWRVSSSGGGPGHGPGQASVQDLRR